jgi:hypothetical protein
MRPLKILAALAFFCGAVAAAEPNLFPLDAGNYWTYRNPDTGHTFTIRIASTPVMHNGNVYHKVTGYTAAPAFLRQAENGNIFRWDDDNDQEILLTSFERVPYGWYDTDIVGCPQGGQVQERKADYRPPAGPDIKATQILYRSYGCADVGVLDEQYVENVGLVRRVVGTIAGPRTYELVYARTATLTYDAQRGNGFVVSLDRNYLVCVDPAATDRLAVTMRLTRRSAPAIDLRFPSAQRYDIRMRDAAGRVVYQWSEDEFFAQAAATIYVADELEYAQQIPARERAGAPLAGGYYTVEAWLATENREFAGATRFFYTPCETSSPAAKPTAPGV